MLLSIILPSTSTNHLIQTYAQVVAGEDLVNAIPLDPIAIGGTMLADNFPGPSSTNGYWFIIELGTNQLAHFYQFRINYDDSVQNFGFTVYDENGNYFDYSSGSTSDASFLNAPQMLGTFYVEIYPTSGTGAFEFGVIDQGTYGDEAYDAMILSVETTTPGQMPGPGSSSETWYEVSIFDTFTTRFSLDAEAATNFDIFVYTYGLSLLGSSEMSSYPEQVELTSTETVLVEIRPITGAGNFTLEIKLLIPDGYDAPHAIPMQVETPTTSVAPNVDGLTTVWYVIDFGVFPGSYLITLTGDAGTSFNFHVFDNETNIIVENVVSGYPKTSEIINVEGINYISISNLVTTGNYSLQVQSFDPVGSEANPIILLLGQFIFEELPGDGSDGSIFYELSINDSFYKFSTAGYNLPASGSGGGVYTTIFDENGTIIDILEADPSAESTHQLVAGDYLIQVQSETEGALFDLRVTEIFEGLFERPFRPPGFTYSGNFDSSFDAWIVFTPPLIEPVNISLSCDVDTWMILSAHDENETYLDGTSGQCSELVNPSISLTDHPDEVYVHVSLSGDFTNYTLSMDCTSCDELPTPTFTWDITGEAFDDSSNTECGAGYTVTFIAGWTDYPSSYLTVEYSAIVSTISGNETLTVEEEMSSFGETISGTGSKTDTSDFNPIATAFVELIVTLFLDGGQEEKMLDWSITCGSEATGPSETNSTSSDTETTTTPTTTTGTTTETTDDDDDLIFGGDETTNTPIDFAYFIVGGIVLILIKRKRNLGV